jgi:hypothetical protein
MLSVIFIYCYAEYHYAECRYAECRGAHKNTHDSDSLDKAQFTGRKLGRVFNSRSSCLSIMGYEAKRPNLKLKTWPKQLKGSLPLAFALPGDCGIPIALGFLGLQDCFTGCIILGA